MSRLGFAGAASVAAMIALILFLARPSPDPAPCGLKVGSSFAFNISSESKAEADLAPLLQRLHKLGSEAMQLEGSSPLEKSEKRDWKVNFEVLGPAGADHILAASVVENGRGPPLGDPFLVRVGPACEIRDFARKDDADRGTAKKQQQMTVVLQWSRPGSGDAGRSFDQYGTFEGVERLEKDGDRSVVRARRVRYEAGFMGLGGAPPKILSSSVTIWPGTGPWLDALESRFVLVLEARSVQAGKVDSHFVAHRTRGESIRLPFPATDPRWVWGHVLDGPTSAPARGETKEIEGLKGKIFSDVIAYYLDLLKEGSNVVERIAYLRAYFATTPAALTAALELLKDPKMLPFGARSELILAMGLADTPEARAALMRLFSEAQFAVHDQHRAAWALIQSANVPEGFVDRVAGRSRQGADPYDRAVMSLVLGAFANRQTTRDSKAIAEASGHLREQLSRASDRAGLLDALAGIGNSGDESLLPAAAPNLASADEDVRVAAVKSLRQMPFDRVEATFAERYSAEESSFVRQEILAAAMQSASGSPRASLESLLRPALARAMDAQTNRTEYIETLKFIGDAVRRGDSEARAALESELQRELRAGAKDTMKLQVLSRYLAPSWRR